METKEKTTQVKKTDGTKAKPRNLGRGLDALIPGMIDGKERLKGVRNNLYG